MTQGALLRLTVEYLRGSVLPFTFPFEKGKKLTIVYGENGTGKSTLCDALDLLGNGNVGSLDRRGLAATKRFWHSVGSMPADVRVTLETSTGNYIASLNGQDVPGSSSRHRPRVEVLRRSQILRLVAARPAERYEAISRFIDVSGVETSEALLRKLGLETKRDLQLAVARVSVNRGAIEHFWTESGKPSGDPLSWAEGAIQTDRVALGRRREAIGNLIGAWEAIARYPSKHRAACDRVKSAEQGMESAQAACSSLAEQVANGYLEVLDILQAAHRHFQQRPDPAVCPLCESSERAAGLAADVDLRIEAQQPAGRLQQSKRALESARLSTRQVTQHLADLEQMAYDETAHFAWCCESADLPVDLALPDSPTPADLTQWQAWFDNNDRFPAEWWAAADECVDIRKFTNTLFMALEALKVNEQFVNDLQRILPAIEQTLAVVERERRAFTDGILQAIAIRVGELYEVVHPGEGLNKISLELGATKRASLEISTEFAGRRDTPPQAYFSDSHLDTLGLCIFLALAEREQPTETILVLDDVLGSVDEPHVERIIQMLYDVTFGFRHCLIATHYSPWRHKYRWGFLKNGTCQFAELRTWSLCSGISLGQSVSGVDRLRSLLAEPSPDARGACSEAGVVLEAILNFLTELYGCRLPRRAEPNYTLGELLPAIDRKLRSVLRVEHRQQDAAGVVTYVDNTLGPHLDALERTAALRNVVGAHFNPTSFGLPDGDALAFAAEVLALSEALVDPVEGWPQNKKSGSYWATHGDTRRLHPLQKPS